MNQLPKRKKNPLARWFYFALSLWMGLIVIVGFWPTYFGPLLAGTLDLKLIVKIHANVYLVWIVIFFVQTLLVLNRRLNWHRKLGWFAVGYAALMIAVVITALAIRFSNLHAAGEIREAHSSLVFSLVDLLLFSGFLTAAIIYRKKPQIHKRLIILTTVVLMGPPAVRITFLTSIPLILAVMLSPILIGMVFDFITRRKVHAVYIIGLILFLVSFAKRPLQDSDAWFNFSKWVYGLFN